MKKEKVKPYIRPRNSYRCKDCGEYFRLKQTFYNHKCPKDKLWGKSRND